MAKRVKTKSLKPIVAEIKVLRRAAVRSGKDAARTARALKTLQSRVESICRRATSKGGKSSRVFFISIP